MHARFEAAHRIEDAIARSDLDGARAQAHELSDLTEPEALPRWRPFLVALASAARQVASAGDILAAAGGAAAVGYQCGRCHAALGVTVSFPDEPRPPENVRLAFQMLGHRWAAARMWEGLIGPAEDRWTAGARALMHAPLTLVAEETTILPTGGEQIGDEVARVRLYANRALAAVDAEERAVTFGAILTTCARCHAAIRDR
ncbi:MAG: hypothetical protein ABIY55_16215 [Kofleriaceae bacterium]